ncbi:helix-turn-helix domain-containing protein [Maribacter sp. 2-571]|uniref:helix-turn-helix domain-containing protein n=1 Tax=Maribacter sp. 2-571 TaxID=3417569 RepID=UPI003D35502F
MSTGLTNHTVSGPALITMGPNVIRKWTRTYRTIAERTVFFNKEFLVGPFSNGGILNNVPYFEQADLHVFELKEADTTCIDSIFERLRFFIDSSYRNKDNFVRQQIAILLYMLDELYTVKNNNPKNNAHPVSVLDQFKALAADNIKTHRTVQFYADTLFVTGKHLSALAKKHIGTTASQFLHDLLILEAKILLQNSNNTVSGIAYELNFPDPSTFGKYFKKYTGRTPAAYRTEILTT